MAAGEEERRQSIIRMYYVRRQGLHWEWHRGCKRVLADWMAVRRMLRLQAQGSPGVT